MEILHVLNNLGDGGAEALVTDLVVENYTRQKHLNMGVLSLIKPITKTHANRASVIKEKGGFSFESFSNLFVQLIDINSVIMKHDVKVVHAHNLRSAILASIVKVIFNRKINVVFTQHTDRLKRPLFHIIVLKRAIDAYVAICQKSFNDMGLRLGKKGRVIQVPNGIPKFKMTENCYKKPGVINMVTIARFDKKKGYHVLLNAISELNNKGLIGKYHFWLIGDGDIRSDMEKLASELKVSSNVTFLGNVYEARQYLKCFDALVIASDYEGLPISALEAIQAKLPIITTDVGGMSELVKDSLNGYLVPKQDPLALANALEILSDESKLNLLKKGARQTSDKYSISNCLNEYLKTYQSINASLYLSEEMYA